MKFKLLIEYDGTRYSGWQMQKNSKTIQGTIIKALEKVFSQTRGEANLIDFQGAGRTDSGVHAYEQTAHLECETMLAPHIMQFKINDELPSDINILKIEKANPGFHARHSAKSRQYLYRISKRRTALEKKFVWWVKDDLNFDKMKNASIHFKGMHDFRSFSDFDKDTKSTKALIESIDLFEAGELICIRIKASHFQWKMVRRITGVLVETGRGNLDASDVKDFLKYESDIPSGFTAPPSGLFLEKVYY